MSNVSDGEDSQMHSAPSSTASTPPAATSSPPHSQPIHNFQLTIDTPPASMHSTPLAAKGGDGGILEDGAGSPKERGHGDMMGGGGGGGMMGMGTAAGGVEQIAPWMGKRAMEEALNAKERLVDRNFSLRWLGDPFDEADMYGR